MHSRSFRMALIMIAATLIGASRVRAGSLSYSHSASSIPDAAGPAISLLSITGTNDGTNYTFTLTFANPTIEGPSSGNNDAVYGFINLDSDSNLGTGPSGAFLDSNGFEPGFGQFSPSTQGIEAYVNLSSEGDPLHGAPGLVDLVTTNGFVPIDAVTITYSDRAGSVASTLVLSIPLSDFSSNQIALLDTGNFAVVVGNANNATDFLPAPASVPEPVSVVLLTIGMPLILSVSSRLARRHRALACTPSPSRA
jgi:hypothetical protein